MLSSTYHPPIHTQPALSMMERNKDPSFYAKSIIFGREAQRGGYIWVKLCFFRCLFSFTKEPRPLPMAIIIESYVFIYKLVMKIITA